MVIEWCKSTINVSYVLDRSSLTLVTIASFIMGLFASNVLSRW